MKSLMLGMFAAAMLFSGGVSACGWDVCPGPDEATLGSMDIKDSAYCHKTWGVWHCHPNG